MDQHQKSNEAIVDLPMTDKICIRDLTVRNIIGVDAWERSKRQPIIINIVVYTSVSQAGDTDHLPYSIHYGVLCKTVEAHSEKTEFRSVEALADSIARVVITKCHAPKLTIRIDKPRALLHAASAGVEITRSRSDYTEEQLAGTAISPLRFNHEDIIFVKDLKLSCIIGVNPWEREEEQVVVVNLKIYPGFDDTSDRKADYVSKTHNYRTIVRTITKYIEASAYKTVEAFVTSVARIAIEKCHVSKITVKVEKPSAIVFAGSAGVEITRDRAFFANASQAARTHARRASHTSAIPGLATLGVGLKVEARGPVPAHLTHVVYLALGSNLGDSAANLTNALRKLEQGEHVRVVDTSFLYETPPMYVTDQPSFLNAACKIMTDLKPLDLLKKIKEIETEMGRDFNTIRNGPRPVDIDILLYDHIEYHDDVLTIPHAAMQEREFVLRPLCDIAKDVEHPKLYRHINQLLSQLLLKQQENKSAITKSDIIHKSIPLRGNIVHWDAKTLIMGILNTTPDSFSDGGNYSTPEAAALRAQQLVDDGADIIDIGGMSTRPNAPEISEEEEIERVVPVILLLRSRGFKTPISVDTFRASVADKAIEAGADLINDVSAGRRDPMMYSVMAKWQVPVCLMHMRGDSKTMMSQTDYGEKNDVVGEISRELNKSIEGAIAAGLHRWNIIVDPGIGFAKDSDQNLQVLRRLPEMIQDPSSPLAGYPCLVGPSRKAFIGHLTQQKDATKRTYGTAAACTASVAGGASIVRVHDVKEIRDVIKVSDAIWRA
ncbi:trifunctional dihydropteroate synthetase [Lobosporangium transversale]|uniref:Folic acid synthesis protein FOL1 n=1 Tax=Lobosporangium transversale TaxID=64571 RepID=A0A1Y2GU58_9FUNG|nr:Dihydropteroate synthase-like protein [Lobosporangium transversale]KAF9913534.1 trifunctional dihydropteroate synthetase [Lobosporangium transversale]ORZ18334.1 Dihydropteroate synthase-like protein [Lobosporangium transversale]|eukprot:XP_021882129.1 Dihydropteroate synthase-like protein [Lobosporangium transversale]